VRLRDEGEAHVRELPSARWVLGWEAG